MKEASALDKQDQGAKHYLHILNKIVKDSKTFGILTFGDVHQGANFGGLRRKT